MIKLHPHRNFPEMALITLAMIALPTSVLLAQNDFRVSPETGLESGSNTLKPATVKKPQPAPIAEKKATEITCTGETTFDAKEGIAVFIKDVKVNDPQFSLTSDKLTAYLKKTVKEPAKGEATAPSPTPAASPTPTPKPDADSSPASGLERAVAEGNVVIIQDKIDEKTGDVVHYVGKGAKADYHAVTGEMTLSGWPQIQQGLNNQVATEETTVMIMDKDGHLTTKGPSKTIMESETKSAKPEKSEKPEPAKGNLLKTP